MLGCFSSLDLTSVKKGAKKKSPVAFTSLPLRVRDFKTLTFFVDEEVATRAVNDGVVIRERDIEFRLEHIPQTCLDRRVG